MRSFVYQELQISISAGYGNSFLCYIYTVAKSIKYYINGHNLLNNKGTQMIKVSLEPQESPARNDCVTFIDIVHFRVF